MKKDAFTSKQACYLSGCTSHQLRYWDKVNLVNPSIQSSNGKPGVPKMYSFRDIVETQKQEMNREKGREHGSGRQT